MNDLLSVVKGNSSYESIADGDVEKGAPGPASDMDPDMQQFFAQVDLTKKNLADIAVLFEEIKAQHEKAKSTVRTKDMQKSRQDMQDFINATNKLANMCKKRLELIDQMNEQHKKKKGCESGSTAERTRTSITAGLKKKLKDHMKEFSDLRTTIQEEYKEVIERRVYTVTGKKISEDEIEAIIDNGDADSIFQKAILEQGRGRVQDTLAEIQERHAAVKDLEQSLLELHQIFLDMAVLVEAQGEMIDNIEKQVARSVDYVAKGTVALQDAKKLQKNTRKWMCIAMIVLLVIALIIVLAVVQPWKMVNTNGR